MEDNLGITADTAIVKYDINVLSEANEVESNPFLENITFDKKVILKRIKKGEVVDNDEQNLPIDKVIELTKENADLKEVGLEIAKRQIKQRASFVLIYTAPIINYKNLSEISLKMFFYICEKRLNLGSDHVILSINECVNEFNVTRQTVTKGFIELIRNKIIYPRMNNVWWINPNYFYAGNRLNIRSK